MTVQTPAEKRLEIVRRIAEKWSAWVLVQMEAGSVGFEHIQAVRECAVEMLTALDAKLDGEPTDYVCYGCGKPILTGEEMIGSDVYSFYSHAYCEAETKRKWIADNPAPTQDDEQRKRTLGRYARDPRFAYTADDDWPANIGDCQSPPARVEAEDAE